MSAVEVEKKPDDNRNLFKAFLKGIFVGFILFFIFVLIAFLFGSLIPASSSSIPPAAAQFLSSPLDMGILGFFIGIGLETYRELV